MPDKMPDYYRVREECQNICQINIDRWGMPDRTPVRMPDKMILECITVSEHMSYRIEYTVKCLIECQNTCHIYK